jgi:HD-GYP domain-containing protein (c-di-GMP phosphodiesterase class II)
MSEEEGRATAERKREALGYFHHKNLMEKVRNTLKAFVSAKKAAAIYPHNHEMCINAIKEFMQAFEDYLPWKSDFSLRLIGDEFFYEERLMARESVLYYPLIMELQSKKVGGITFETGLSASELSAFLSLLNLGSDELESKGGLIRLMQERGIVHISLDEPGTWEEKPGEEKRRPSGREDYLNAVDVIREIADQVMSDRRLAVSKANKVVGAMLNRVGENRAAVLGLASIKSYDEYTSFHSVNVLILSLALGSMLPLDRNALMILGTGALLHDLGKVTIPQNILNKTGPLTSQEWRVMKDHPVRGADILLAQPGVHPLSVTVAYEHHAQYDLKGYPKINGKKSIGLLPRIVEVVDVYDAMTTKRPYQDSRTPEWAIRTLAKGMGTVFDPLLVKVFIDMMGIYPVGTLVRLVTGELGIVYEQNDGEIMLPKVKVIRDAEGGEIEPRIVDLIRFKEKIGEAGRAILETIPPELIGLDIMPFL